MKTKILITSFIVAFLLSACGTTTPATPTVDVQTIYTVAAKTVVAELTQTAAAATPTPPPTATLEIINTATPVNTSTSAPTDTPPPTETAQASPTLSVEASPTDYLCNNAAWVADVSVQDGAHMSPGQEFEKTWRIKNIGSCTWGAGYGIIYGYGIEMNGQPYPLSESVFPGGVVDITVKFTAPDAAGEYKSYWRMANASATNFGEFFYVEISVP